MARNVGMLDVFSQYARTKEGLVVNPVETYLMNAYLGKSGLYQPSPRPEVLIINSWSKEDVESVFDYHVSNHMMYHEDIRIDTIPVGFNLLMLRANMGAKCKPGYIPMEAMQKRELFDMWITRSPEINDYTINDWLALFMFGAYALRPGGVSITYLQDVDLDGFDNVVSRLKGAARLEPAVYEETPFTMEDGLGKDYNRICIYKKPEWEPPRAKDGFICSN